eukprot:5846066-Prymnesium_polylepis.2
MGRLRETCVVTAPCANDLLMPGMLSLAARIAGNMTCAWIVLQSNRVSHMPKMVLGTARGGMRQQVVWVAVQMAPLGCVWMGLRSAHGARCE